MWAKLKTALIGIEEISRNSHPEIRRISNVTDKYYVFL